MDERNNYDELETESLYEITSWYYRILPMALEDEDNQDIEKLKEFLYMAIRDMYRIEKSIENDVELISEDYLQELIDSGEMWEDEECDCDECCDLEDDMEAYDDSIDKSKIMN